MSPQHKISIKITFLILCVIYIVILLLGPLLNIEYFIAYNLGTCEELIHSRFILWNPISILLSILSGTMIIFGGGGFIKKGIQSTGVVKRRYFYISTAYFLYLIAIMLETLFLPTYILILTRIFIFAAPIFLYIGVRKISVEHKKKKSKSEITVQEGLFRIYKRHEIITEEEITFHKEKKICLVCNRKVSKLLYICPGCDALYCIKCYNALINAENVCWVCDTTLDESKPSNPFKKEEEDKKEIEKIKI